VKTPRLAATALLVGLVAALGGTARADSSSGHAWAPAATATVHPGVQTLTNGAQCTTNFVFFDASNVYIGQAAHCSGTGGSTETNGCTSGVLPEGTKVNVSGASNPGTIVYNSWATMHKVGEKDANTCAGNDFALVRLDPRDAGIVNPTVPFWGGPAGVNTSGVGFGDRVYAYGNSELRLGLSELSPQTGIATGEAFGGWMHTTFTITPSVPGDSGSAVLDGSGAALGVLTQLQIGVGTGGLPVQNGVADIGRELSYMKAHVQELAGVQLAKGTEPFSPLI